MRDLEKRSGLIVDLPAAILGGGGSNRFGRPKGLALLEGEPLLAHIATKLADQTIGPIGLNAPEASPYRNIFSGECFADILQGQLGPLAGIHTAMDWARRKQYSHVITTAIDTPFIPDDFIEHLHQAGAPAIASSYDRLHGVCGFWRTSDEKVLREFINDGGRRLDDWIGHISARPVIFDVHNGRDPFFNINTLSDASEAGLEGS